MNTRKPRYPDEEFASRGRELYERTIKPQLEDGNRGRIVAIDIDSGDYELGDDQLAVCMALVERRPDAQIWCERIGFPAVHRFAPMPNERSGEGLTEADNPFVKIAE